MRLTTVDVDPSPGRVVADVVVIGAPEEVDRVRDVVGRQGEQRAARDGTEAALTVVGTTPTSSCLVE